MGRGLTVMMKVFDGPLQLTEPLVMVGVTVMVAIAGAVPVFIATNAGILPVPVAPSPMLVLLFVQVYKVVPPVLTVPKVTSAVLIVLQTSWSAGRFTCPVGLTVMRKVFDGPLQLIEPLVMVGVTMMVAITGAVPVFIATNAGMLPVPDAPSPMPGELFVQV